MGVFKLFTDWDDFESRSWLARFCLAWPLWPPLFVGFLVLAVMPFLGPPDTCGKEGFRPEDSHRAAQALGLERHSRK